MHGVQSLSLASSLIGFVMVVHVVSRHYREIIFIGAYYPVKGYTAPDLFFHWWTFGFFSDLAVLNNAAMPTLLLGIYARSQVVRSWALYMFNLSVCIMPNCFPNQC